MQLLPRFIRQKLEGKSNLGKIIGNTDWLFADRCRKNFSLYNPNAKSGLHLIVLYSNVDFLSGLNELKNIAIETKKNVGNLNIDSRI